jgi:hypothetical protein
LSKLTKPQREELKSLVATASLRRLTAKETSAFVQQQLGFSISEDHIRRVRMYIKQDCAKETLLLQKDVGYFLQRMFFDRVAELEYQQKVLHQVIDNDKNKDNPDVQIKAVNALHAITETMTRLYTSLPLSTIYIPPDAVGAGATAAVIPFDSNPSPVQQRLERGQKEPILDEHDLLDGDGDGDQP